MFTFAQRLSIVKALHACASNDVKYREALEHRNAPAFYTFTFTFCDREITSYVLTNGRLLGSVNEQNGVKEHVDHGIVDGALKLAAKVHKDDIALVSDVEVVA